MCGVIKSITFIIEEFETLSKDYEDEQSISGVIGEEITRIGEALSTFQALKKLSTNPSVLNESTFAGKLSYSELVKLTVNLVKSVNAVRKNLQDVRKDLENYDPIYCASDSSPQLVSDISELKTKFDIFVSQSTQPAPVDYAKC